MILIAEDVAKVHTVSTRRSDIQYVTVAKIAYSGKGKTEIW